MPWDSACSAPVACPRPHACSASCGSLSPSSPLAADAARQLRVIGEGGLGGPAPTPKERIERAERLLGAGAGDSARSEAEALLDAKLPADLAARALKIVADAARRAGRVDAATATVNRALGELPADRRAPWLLDLARLQQRKSSDLALATLDKLVREYPKSPEAAEGLGLKARTLESAGRVPDAEAVYQKLAADYPDQEEGGQRPVAAGLVVVVPRRPCRGGGSVGPAGGRARRTGAPRGRGVLDRARSRAARRRRCGRASVRAGAGRWAAELLRHPRLPPRGGAGPRRGGRSDAPRRRARAPRGEIRASPASRRSAPWGSRASRTRRWTS